MSAPDVYRNLGAARIEAGDVAGALAPLRVAHRLVPEDEGIRRVLGQALYVLGEQDRLDGRLESARDRFAEAADADPDNAAAWNGLGQSHVGLGAMADGAACYRRALALRPDAAAILSNLGNALVRLLDHDGAEDAYRRALALDPDNAEFRHNHALHLLRTGRLEAGWDLFPVRLQRPGRRPPCDGPFWDGGDPAGRTVAVWSEQGIGDELMFGTCIPDLAAEAGHVVWECGPKLAPLLRRSLPEVTVVARPANAEAAVTPAERFPWREAVGPIDAWAACGALAGVYRRTPGAFAGSGGYLSADPALRRVAAQWLAHLPRPRIGLCWRGGVVNATRGLVYAQPAQLAATLAGTGATPVLLQYGATGAERAACTAAGTPLAVMPDLDLADDLEGVAALIAELDLVISCASSVAELAGALGVPVWRFGPQSDWTLLGAGLAPGYAGRRRPWFCTMRAFTKPDADPNWTPVFDALRTELRMVSPVPA
ncbi:MAG: tetratricopeptide repeat protein [Alphaproteobacteria bacterium]